MGHRDQNCSGQFRLVTLEKLAHPGDLFINSQFHQPDDRTLWQAANENEFAEILIFRHKNAPIL